MTLDEIVMREQKLFARYLGNGDRWYLPDLTLAPAGETYLYRWHVVPRNDDANVYFHVQVGPDPGPLHDHMYDNQSVILRGGYREEYVKRPSFMPPQFINSLAHPAQRVLAEGDVVHRGAAEAHRLHMLPDNPYTVTLFTTGPRVREWGYWRSPTEWVPWTEMTNDDYRNGGVSTLKKEMLDA